MAPEYNPRVAIVTGAAQGIGFSIATRLADDGLDVGLNDIPSKLELLEKVAEEIRSKGRKAVVVTADVAVEVEVKNMIEKVAAELGSVDIVSYTRIMY